VSSFYLVADIGKTLVFGASAQFKLLAGSYVALFLLVLANIKTHLSAAYILTAAFAVLPVFAWPPAITVSDAGVTSRSVWGRRRTIRWSELRRVIVSQKQIDIIANNGQSIRHTLLHARRGWFLGELARRVPEKVLYRA
jgi:hypothetical protein